MGTADMTLDTVMVGTVAMTMARVMTQISTGPTAAAAACGNIRPEIEVRQDVGKKKKENEMMERDSETERHRGIHAGQGA
ncbi:unnamed protein product [Merluccius merluccius]